jgi:rhamnosyltransferase subunit B
LARIVLNTFGSFGDLHPYLAIAIELQRRGHDAVVATSEVYRAKVLAEGVGFAPVRPDVGELLGDTEFLRKIWDPRRGSEYLYRDYLLPNTKNSFEDLIAVCKGADLLLTHFGNCAGPIVGECSKLAWLSVALQPIVFFSRADPSVLPIGPWLRHFYRFGAFPPLRALAKMSSARWSGNLVELRRRFGLPTRQHPLFEGQFSPMGTLALFSRHFAKPQEDWPPKTRATGFVFYDRRGEGFGRADGLEADLERFLDQGPAPVLFTLGSSAVTQPGTFFRESAEAAKLLGVRAVLLVGPLDDKSLTEHLPPSIFVAEYAPFSELMPRAKVNIHQGGIGTTGQALRAGKPMIVVPWSHDQPDNAERLRRLGVSRTIGRSRYTRERVTRELQRLLQDMDCKRRAEDLGRLVAAEDGLQKTCKAIESVLRNQNG